MSIPILYDACVLYGNEVRDPLIRIAISGMVRAHWTDEILDETFGNLVANRPDLPPERLMVTRARMNAAVPRALVSGYETLEDLRGGPRCSRTGRPGRFRSGTAGLIRCMPRLPARKARVYHEHRTDNPRGRGT